MKNSPLAFRTHIELAADAVQHALVVLLSLAADVAVVLVVVVRAEAKHCQVVVIVQSVHARAESAVDAGDWQARFCRGVARLEEAKRVLGYLAAAIRAERVGETQAYLKSVFVLAYRELNVTVGFLAGHYY